MRAWASRGGGAGDKKEIGRGRSSLAGEQARSETCPTGLCPLGAGPIRSVRGDLFLSILKASPRPSGHGSRSLGDKSGDGGGRTQGRPGPARHQRGQWTSARLPALSTGGLRPGLALMSVPVFSGPSSSSLSLHPPFSSSAALTRLRSAPSSGHRVKTAVSSADADGVLAIK